MNLRLFFVFAALLIMVAPAQAKRVALVIGQNGYKSLSKLANPQIDARRMATLLKINGFEVIACDGKIPGCFDQGATGCWRRSVP